MTIDLPEEAVEQLVEAHRSYLHARPCTGITYVVYVPPGRTVDDVWEEITTAGRINGDIADGGEWVTVECGGGDGCSCRGIDPSPTFRHHHNDRQVWPPLPDDDKEGAE